MGMAWYLKKRFKLFPGVNLNLSKNGPGISVGPRGAKLSYGPKGLQLNAGRNGLYYRKSLNGLISNGSTNPQNIETIAAQARQNLYQYYGMTETEFSGHVVELSNRYQVDTGVVLDMLMADTKGKLAWALGKLILWVIWAGLIDLSLIAGNHSTVGLIVGALWSWIAFRSFKNYKRLDKRCDDEARIHNDFGAISAEISKALPLNPLEWSDDQLEHFLATSIIGKSEDEQRAIMLERFTTQEQVDEFARRIEAVAEKTKLKEPNA
jgi:hypothetical protein